MTCNPEISGEKEISPRVKGFVHPVSLTICTGFQDINVKYNNCYFLSYKVSTSDFNRSFIQAKTASLNSKYIRIIKH